MKKEEYYEIRGSISKTRLARAYAPELADSSARKRLVQWLHHHPTLIRQLEATGYTKNARIFTPNQVRIIFDCLGEP